MINDNQFAVYQLKRTQETRQIRFLPYEMLLKKGIRIKAEDYEQVYVGSLHRQDTPESIRERLERQLPHSFTGHSVSVSDVLVLNNMGTVISYYFEKTGFTIIENFIRNKSSPSGSAVTIDTVNFHIEGKAGSWLAFDSIRMDGQEFFLMEHETYGKEAAWVVVDRDGKLAVDNVRDGFGQEVRKLLAEYLHLSQAEDRQQEKNHKQTELVERERTQMYQEGAVAGKVSVLARLHKKQVEIAERNRRKKRQAVMENGMG